MYSTNSEYHRELCCAFCVLYLSLTEAPNPLVVPLESSLAAKARRTKLWFSQAGVQGILGTRGGGGEEEGGGEEIEKAVEAFRMKGGRLWEREGGQDTAIDDATREL